MLAPPLTSPTIAEGRCFAVLLRLAYLGVTNAFAVLRLLTMSEQDKDAEILALRHQIAVLRPLCRAKLLAWAVTCELVDQVMRPVSIG